MFLYNTSRLCPSRVFHLPSLLDVKMEMPPPEKRLNPLSSPAPGCLPECLPSFVIMSPRPVGYNFSSSLCANHLSSPDPCHHPLSSRMHSSTCQPVCGSQVYSNNPSSLNSVSPACYVSLGGGPFRYFQLQSWDLVVTTVGSQATPPNPRNCSSFLGLPSTVRFCSPVTRLCLRGFLSLRRNLIFLFCICFEGSVDGCTASFSISLPVSNFHTILP